MTSRNSSRVSRGQSKYDSSNLNNVVLCPPEIKCQKWRRVMVRLGGIKVPRWVPENDRPSENLQQYMDKNRKMAKKAHVRKIRKTQTVVESKAEIIEE